MRPNSSHKPARPLLAGPLPLLLVLALALALRAWGLGWGLPSATHYFSYHPDETVVLDVASRGMNVFAGRLLPHFYNYGSLQLYLVCFANTLAALSGAVDIVPKDYAVWYPEWAKMYLVGRWLTVGMGVGTVWATYAVGRQLWGRRAGLLAALTLAVMPLHAQHSHFLTVDVPGTLWVTLSLVWAARLMRGDPHRLRAALWAGVFAGLAAATKYNLALVILPVLAACVVRIREEKAIGLLTLAPPLLGAGGAFLAACPGAILENAAFVRDIRYEAVHVQNMDDPTFKDTGSGFVYHITHNLDAGLGLPLLCFSLFSVGYALYRRQPGDGLLAAFAVPYYVLIGLAAVKYARYVIPLLPIFAVWTGRLLADVSRLTRPSLQRIGMIVGTGVLIWTSFASFWLVRVMAGTDTRDAALTWIKAHATASATFGYAAQPWFGTAPINPYFSLPRPGGWRQITPPEAQRRIFYTGKDWNLDLLKSANPDFVILSEYDYDDALRRRDPSAIAYIDYLQDSNNHLYFWDIAYSPDNWGFPKWVGEEQTSNTSWVRKLQTRDLPHDMLYPSPIIYIFSHTPPKETARE